MSALTGRTATTPSMAAFSNHDLAVSARCSSSFGAIR